MIASLTTIFEKLYMIKHFYSSKWKTLMSNSDQLWNTCYMQKRVSSNAFKKWFIYCSLLSYVLTASILVKLFNSLFKTTIMPSMSMLHYLCSAKLDLIFLKVYSVKFWKFTLVNTHKNKLFQIDLCKYKNRYTSF